jgi:hypothetical protein
MALGPDVPGWLSLHEALIELVIACRGAFAAVVDEGNGLWCIGRPTTDATLDSAAPDNERAMDQFYRAEIAPRSTSLRRGVKLDIVCRPDAADGEPRYIAESFASIYVLVMWFDGPFEAELARARLKRALPRIEALTLSLPPSGPETGEGAGKARA